jgi:hypothetical protein
MSNQQKTDAQVLAEHASQRMEKVPAHGRYQKERDILAQNMLDEIAEGTNLVMQAEEVARLQAIEEEYNRLQNASEPVEE